MELSLIFGYILAIAVGLSMGIMGSGGSILTLPIFVYLFHLAPAQALDYSLFTISTISIIGSISHLQKKEIDLKMSLFFILPSFISVYMTKQYILPRIPDHFQIYEMMIHKDQIIMTLFAIIMIASALAMIKKRDDRHQIKTSRNNTELMISIGFLIGILTGLVGAGGGFIIVPALILLLGNTIKQATAASLFIIAINTAFGLLSNFKQLNQINWTILIIFTGITLIGLMIGIQLKTKLKSEKLKVGFGYFLGAIGLIIASIEINQFINL